jgi:hypothetical protein
LGGGLVALSDVTVPHFNLPFQWDAAVGGTNAAVVEQDSLEDISACVTAAMLTRIGQRTSEPTFGITEPAFELQPLDVNQIVQEVAVNEPRALLLAETSPDVIDQLIARTQINVSQRESNA